MKKVLALTALLSTFAVLSATAAAAPLADNLPAGALFTLETKNAGPTFDRLLGLVNTFGKKLGAGDEIGTVAEGAGGVFKGSIGKEASAGLYSVGSVKGGFVPALLAVSQVDAASGALFKTLLPKRAGAKIGKYTFVRQGGAYAGMSGGLVYIASDKSLLTGYLNRLNGQGGPRLNTSAAYTTPSRARGEQEFGLYLNFSATAKLIRGQLGKVFVPRLFSPVVDALDTLGQYSSGFSTTDTGLVAQSAHAPNPAGKDGPLYTILTHTTDFGVQSLVPASAESVSASACASQANGYLGRWLTRLDLFDVTGFLTDSQLAANLEQSARYMGDECAQVVLAGGSKASVDSNPLASLDYSVSYGRVTDLNAAKAHMPEYAAAVNMAIQGLATSLSGLGKSLDSIPGLNASQSSSLKGAQLGLQQQLTDLTKQIAALKLVYGFRGDYLVTAFSDVALKTALDPAAPTLADDGDFQAAGLKLSGTAGWSYGRAAGKIEAKDLLAAIEKSYATDKTLNTPAVQDILKPVSEVLADLYNRYGGMSSQTTVENGLIVMKSAIKYGW